MNIYRKTEYIRCDQSDISYGVIVKGVWISAVATGLFRAICMCIYSMSIGIERAKIRVRTSTSNARLNVSCMSASVSYCDEPVGLSLFYIEHLNPWGRPSCSLDDMHSFQISEVAMTGSRVRPRIVYRAKHLFLGHS